jgi:homoserine dehydrogenase
MIGFGNVGKEFVRLLIAKRGELRDGYDIDWRLTGIASRRIGWVADCNGLDPEELLAHQFPPLPAWKTPHSLHQWLATADPQVFFEASSLDWRTGQPAIDHLKAALESRRSCREREQRPHRARLPRASRFREKPRAQIPL